MFGNNIGNGVSRRKFLKKTATASAVFGSVSAGAYFSSNNVRAASNYGWLQDKLDTQYTVVSATKEYQADLGSSLMYKETFQPGSNDYVIHEMRLNNTGIAMDRYQNEDWKLDWVQDQKLDATITSPNNSEIIPNYFADDDYVGATPSSGSSPNYDDAVLSLVEAAVGALSPEAGAFITAYNIYSTLVNDTSADTGNNRNVSYDWSYGSAGKVDSFMSIWWKTPHNEYSTVDFTGEATSTPYSLDHQNHWGIQYDDTSSASTSGTSRSITLDSIPNTIPSDAIDVRKVQKEDVNSASPLAKDAAGDDIWAYKVPEKLTVI